MTDGLYEMLDVIKTYWIDSSCEICQAVGRCWAKGKVA